jgi:hypothetical protein
MWFSADAHVYDAHCDTGDGVLFQLKGEKVMEVWPVPAERGKQALFIPAGAMHEVTVGADQVSVSRSAFPRSWFQGQVSRDVLRARHVP